MAVDIFDLNHTKNYDFIMVVPRNQSMWIFTKEKRKPWTFPTAKIESGETPLNTAMRALKEKTGADAFNIKPIFDCCLIENNAIQNGIVFYADIISFSKTPPLKAEKLMPSKVIPDNSASLELYSKTLEQLHTIHKLEKLNAK